MSTRLPTNAARAKAFDLAHGPILSTLIKLSLPNSLALTATILVTVGETAYVSLLGTTSLAGMAVVFPIVILQQSWSNGAMGGGVSAAISRAIGASDQLRAESLALHALILGLACGLIIASLMLWVGPSIYYFLGARDASLDKAIRYSNIVFAGSLPVWLTGMMFSILRGTGDMRLPSKTLVMMMLFQLCIGGCLALGLLGLPRLEIEGVALGQVIAYICATLFLFAHLRSASARVPLRFKGIRLEWNTFAEILKVGLITCIAPLQTNLTLLIVTGMISHLGAETLAGYAIGARLEIVLVPIAFSVGFACVPMVGVAVGRNNIARAKRVAASGAALSGCLVGAIGLTVVIAPDLWTQLFSTNEVSRLVANQYLLMSGLAYGFFGVGLCLLPASQGAGKVIGPVLAGTVRLIVMILGGYWLTQINGPVSYYFILVAVGMVAFGLYAAAAVNLSNWAPSGERIS